MLENHNFLVSSKQIMFCLVLVQFSCVFSLKFYLERLFYLLYWHEPNLNSKCFVFNGFSYNTVKPAAGQGLFPRRLLKCWCHVIDIQGRRNGFKFPSCPQCWEVRCFLPRKKGGGCCSHDLGLRVMAGFLTALSSSFYLQFEGGTALELR